MGDRANLNIISERVEGSFVGLSLYSHWGGTKDLARAINAISEGEVPCADAPYGSRILMSRFISDHEGTDNYGVMPVALKTADDFYSFHQGTDHANLTVDFTNKLITVSSAKDGKIILQQGFTAEGAKEILAFLN